MAKKVKKVAKKTTKKFVRKDEKKDEKKFVGDEGGAFDALEFVKEAKTVHKDIFVPKDEMDELLQVTDWIKMPKVIQSIIGAPGIPCGLITMAYGLKDCGKTTLVTEALSSVQKDGGIAVLIDTENKYNLKRAAAIGVDVERLIIIPAVTVENVFDRLIGIINLIRSKPEWRRRKICIVWDSLGGTPTDQELDDTSGNFAMTAARVIKGGLRKTVRMIHDMKVAFMIINHVYTKAGVSFGKKTTTYGGGGPEYYSALMLELVRVGRVRPIGLKSPEPFCGIKTIITAEKNHLAQPFLSAEVQIDWKGFVIDRSPEYAPEGFYLRPTRTEVDVDLDTGEILNDDTGL